MSVLTTFANAQTVLRVGGSDILGPLVQKALVDLAGSRGDEVKLQFRGSIIGLSEMREDNLDMAIVAIPRGGSMPSEVEYKTIPLAYFAVSIVVNNSNPLTQINMDQLSSTLGSQEGESYSNWGDFGLEGLWQNRNINVALSSNQVGLSFEILRNYTVGTGDIKANAMRSSNPQEIIKRLADDTAAIGSLPYGVSTEGLRVLQVAAGGDQVAYAPTEDNIYFGDYPLTLPFYIVVPKGKLPKVKAYMKELLSTGVADELGKHYLMSLPRSQRQQYTLELDVQ